jgi:F-type H+-transporting ATPase subunit b
MEKILTIVAATTEHAEEEKDLFSAIGIDWTLLIVQTLAFLVLLWFLAKFVYPPINRMLEKRESDIEAGVQAAKNAEEKADKAQSEMDAMLKKARKEASEIVTTAKQEATAAVEAADSKAKIRADRIVAEAHEQIEKDVLSAKKALQNETLTLVAQATEKVVGKTVTAKVDENIVAEAIKEAK